MASSLVLEGDVDHPADFEQVAFLDGHRYEDMVTRYPEAASTLREHLLVDGGDHLVSYGRARRSRPSALSPGLLAELAAHDVYETPPDTFRRLALRRWQLFAARALAERRTWVFDCCFLQNPLTVLLARHDVDPEVVRDHVRAVAATVRELAPVVVHLESADLRATLERAARARPPAWWEFFVEYHTRQAYGRGRGLSGVDGTVAFLRERTALERELLSELPLDLVRIDTSNGWDDAERALRDLADSAWGGSPRPALAPGRVSRPGPRRSPRSASG